MKYVLHAILIIVACTDVLKMLCFNPRSYSNISNFLF